MKIMKKIIYILLPLLSVATIVLAWVLVAAPEESQMPGLAETGAKFIDVMTNKISGATLPIHILVSLRRVLMAVALAMVTGVVFGVLIGWSKLFKSLAYPIFEIIRPIPPIAWLPIIILSMGIGESPKIAIVFISAFMPIVINTFAGMRMIDPSLFDAAKTLGANKRQLFFNIAIPACTPAIVAGMKTSVSNGWMTVLAAEMIVARQGVGFLIVRGMQNGDPALIVVCMFAIGIVSALVSVGLTKIEGVLTKWKNA